MSKDSYWGQKFAYLFILEADVCLSGGSKTECNQKKNAGRNPHFHSLSYEIISECQPRQP